MDPKDAYETGARKYPAATGPDPHDDFSQDAAGNKPPAQGLGNAEAGSDAKARGPGETEARPARPTARR